MCTWSAQLNKFANTWLIFIAALFRFCQCCCCCCHCRCQYELAFQFQHQFRLFARAFRGCVSLLHFFYSICVVFVFLWTRHSQFECMHWETRSEVQRVVNGFDFNQFKHKMPIQTFVLHMHFVRLSNKIKMWRNSDGTFNLLKSDFHVPCNGLVQVQGDSFVSGHVNYTTTAATLPEN